MDHVLNHDDELELLSPVDCEVGTTGVVGAGADRDLSASVRAVGAMSAPANVDLRCSASSKFLDISSIS